MSSTKKRINHTGRRKILREVIDIELHPAAMGESLSATPRLDLSNMKLPEDAAVVIEAYHKSSGMRFDCGTVGNLNLPPKLELDQFDPSVTVLFRIKVVDTDQHPGRLIASAERVRPRSEDEDKGRRSIFPIRECDLGHEVWRTDIDQDGGPVLKLNFRIPGFKQAILDNAMLRGLLLPAALRPVLEEIARNPSFDEDDETDWKRDWISFCKDQLDSDPEDIDRTDEEGAENWIRNAAQTFCQDNGFVDAILATMKEEIR